VTATLPARLDALSLITATVDEGSWVSWDAPPAHGRVSDSYADDLRRAREKAGSDEAVLTGKARIRGREVALVVSEFRFLGGSIGRATAQRIVAAVRRATAERLPLIAAPASGGTRMQEGTPAFVRMVDITRAVVDHKNAGLPYLVYLRHPTTGGVLASWGSLGHVTVAEPGALVGFLGPAVYEALNGEPFPAGVQLSDNLVEKGVIDAVVRPEDLAEVAARVLDLLVPAQADPAPVTARAESVAIAGGPDAWQSIQISRDPRRPGVRDLLRLGADDVLPLSGTAAGEPADGLLAAFASIDGISCVVIGQDRKAQARNGPLGPDDLRAARRMMAVAEQLRLPLVCVVDTAGASLSVEAEEGGLASEIARCLADLVELSVPSVSIVMGEGCGGAALALLPARRVVVAENAWVSPLPPEGAATILTGDPGLAPQLARAQRVRAVDLLADGIAHTLVPEPTPAHDDPENFCRRLAHAATAALRSQMAN